MQPLIFLNFKAYPEATGRKALRLANLAKKIPAKVILCVQAIDLALVAQKTRLQVFAQHADKAEGGAHTGSVTLTAIKNAGAKGVMLNHSEKRVDLLTQAHLVEAARKLQLKTLLCVKDLREAQAAIHVQPDFIAFEIPELIGSSRPITSEQPASVAAFAKLFSSARTIPLCGAGINRAEDVRLALQLGTKGVLAASAFVKKPTAFINSFKKD